jgi:hypothetical protein
MKLHGRDNKVWRFVTIKMDVIHANFGHKIVYSQQRLMAIAHLIKKMSGKTPKSVIN